MIIKKSNQKLRERKKTEDLKPADIQQENSVETAEELIPQAPSAPPPAPEPEIDLFDIENIDFSYC